MRKNYKAIKGIFCTHARRRIHIAVYTRIVKGEYLPIEGSVHCRYDLMYGCNSVDMCERINKAYEQWQDEGMRV